MKTVGIVTIHDICNFGSLLQAFATQTIVDRLGYSSFIINYRYPNEYHLAKIRQQSPYATFKLPFCTRLRVALYSRTKAKDVRLKKLNLFKSVQNTLLKQTMEYPNQESLTNNPPKFDIYLTGSDQVWNPRYMYSDLTYFLDFIHDVPKIAFSASFGTTNLTEEQKNIYRPLLGEYTDISLREQSGVHLVYDICGKESLCTCDPTLLLDGKEWSEIFHDEPLVEGEYILCYILTYTANPYPYAATFLKHIQKYLKKKIVILDETGMYWMDFRYKSYQCYGPKEIINLFQNASFVVSSSFHGAAFSVIFRKDFYSLFPKGINDERQESFLRTIGAYNRFVRVGDPLPDFSTFEIKNWDDISIKLDAYRQKSINYLSKALDDAAKIAK